MHFSKTLDYQNEIQKGVRRGIRRLKEKETETWRETEILNNQMWRVLFLPPNTSGMEFSNTLKSRHLDLGFT